MSAIRTPGGCRRIIMSVREKRKDRVTQERERCERNRCRGSACCEARMIVMPRTSPGPLLVRSHISVHWGPPRVGRLGRIPVLHRDTIRFPSKCPGSTPARTGSPDNPGAPSRHRAGARKTGRLSLHHASLDGELMAAPTMLRQAVRPRCPYGGRSMICPRHSYRAACCSLASTF
jgi:hypothetical protein